MIRYIFNLIIIVMLGLIALQSNIAAANNYRYSPDATRIRMEQQKDDIRRRQFETEQRSQIHKMDRWRNQMEINQRLERAQSSIKKVR